MFTDTVEILAVVFYTTTDPLENVPFDFYPKCQITLYSTVRNMNECAFL